jgi:transaldolase/glucose-6-phosphate isomerase
LGHVGGLRPSTLPANAAGREAQPVRDAGELVERIWERDPTVWTGKDEAQWLGWLDEPLRMRERVAELTEFAAGVADDTDDVVLLGMGGSSLAPESLRRAFGVERFHVLDTTHPKAIRRLADSLDLRRTLFIAASKSGTTLETRSHLEFFWERAGKRAVQFAAITDPGSELEQLARERGFRAVFSGEPTIGGRYSALSPFGLVPAALMQLDLPRLLDRAETTLNACRVADDNPGLALGLALGHAWEEGRDKVVFPAAVGFGLWLEQLLAESTGKDGKGLVPAPGEGADGDDRQAHDLLVDDPYDLGSEFYRWEFATAVAGVILGIDPFDQPNVQEAKDRTSQILSAGQDLVNEPESSIEELLAQARPGDYVAIQAFVDPTEEERLQPLVARARETGCVVTCGFGPRYLHSTGQLHKGGAPIGCFLQVVDDTGEELAIPGRKFGFGRLIRAQAAGDYAALAERGRPVARVRLEDL